MDLPNLEVNLMFPAGFIHDLLHLLADSGVSQVDVLQFSGFGRVNALSQGLETGAAPEVVGRQDDGLEVGDDLRQDGQTFVRQFTHSQVDCLQDAALELVVTFDQHLCALLPEVAVVEVDLLQQESELGNLLEGLVRQAGVGDVELLKNDSSLNFPHLTGENLQFYGSHLVALENDVFSFEYDGYQLVESVLTQLAAAHVQLLQLLRPPMD